MQPRILVVDDDVQVVQAICGHLEEMGFDVLTAASGQLALTRIVLEAPRSPIHGVLLDSDLSARTRSAVIREIKGWDPNIRIIMMSGIQDSPDVFKALMDGADDLITKPIDPSMLREKCLSKFLR